MRLSIIIPVYNVEKYIAEYLRSSWSRIEADWTWKSSSLIISTALKASLKVYPLLSEADRKRYRQTLRKSHRLVLHLRRSATLNNCLQGVVMTLSPTLYLNLYTLLTSLMSKK